MPSPVTYFPNGAPIQSGKAFSPITSPHPGVGPDNIQLFQSPSNPERQSDEQGVGRSPGQRWPHRTHTGQYSYESLTNQADHATDLRATHPERSGWSAPLFFEQAANQHHVFPVPIAIEQAPTHTYTGIASIPA